MIFFGILREYENEYLAKKPKFILGRSTPYPQTFQQFISQGHGNNNPKTNAYFGVFLLNALFAKRLLFSIPIRESGGV
jgi:hypothetical protein